jgi:thioredoxin reductase (NADPH)
VHQGLTAILATGTTHRLLGLPGEEDLIGSGISFCAVCDGDFYTGKKVCVAGGGNSALQEAVLLAEKCSEVVMLQDLDFFTGEEKLQEVLFARDNVKSYAGVKLTALHTAGSDAAGAAAFTGAAGGEIGTDTTFTGVTIEHTSGVSGAPGSQERIDCDGLFVAIGLIPENDPFAELCDLNSYG